jgi:hypothetical protein
MTRKEQSRSEVLCSPHMLDYIQWIMRKINFVEKKEDNDQEGEDPGQPEVLGSPATSVRM